ncbi:hypothetical protein JTE90_001246 [Oedothorax gibbosus]|uniref:Uncharacterized protein n=1 Tax=Oedothorax gibbosus TaxID=931172 RepID=A0AAV6VV81_9ARAC|nr:hypothetical protein JTE90_001246 [Oedothorax gibbosus]
MHLTIFLAAVLLLVLFSPADAGSCQVPTPVGAFSASIYTALIVSTDPEITESLELEGAEAALKLYIVIRDDLELFGLCNAEPVAFAAAKEPPTPER